MLVSLDRSTCWLLLFHTADREGEMDFFKGKMWLQNRCLERSGWQNQCLNIFFILSPSACDSLNNLDSMWWGGDTSSSHSSSLGQNQCREQMWQGRAVKQNPKYIQSPAIPIFQLKNTEQPMAGLCCREKATWDNQRDSLPLLLSHTKHSGKIPNYI